MCHLKISEMLEIKFVITRCIRKCVIVAGSSGCNWKINAKHKKITEDFLGFKDTERKWHRVVWILYECILQVKFFIQFHLLYCVPIF